MTSSEQKNLSGVQSFNVSLSPAMLVQRGSHFSYVTPRFDRWEACSITLAYIEWFYDSLTGQIKLSNMTKLFSLHLFDMTGYITVILMITNHAQVWFNTGRLITFYVYIYLFIFSLDTCSWNMKTLLLLQPI